MALFDESTITDSGVELLNAQLAGQRLTVTSAYAGTGCVDKDLLHAQTDLVDQRQKTVLVSLESYEDHKRIRVQISNAGLQEGYKLQQLLINAVLDSAENSEETALLIMQDPKGIDMPSETESPGFELEMYCVLLVTNKLQIGLIVDPAGTVKFKDLKRTLEAHNADETAHAGIRAELAEVRETAEAAGHAQKGEGAPSEEMAAQTGDRYFDTAANVEYACVGVAEDGRPVWKRTAFHEDLTEKAVFSFVESDWRKPGSVELEEGAEYDGAEGYEIVIPAEKHGRKSGDFGFHVFHLVDGTYTTNTWAAFGTEARYEADGNSIVLWGENPYSGKILFVG